MMNQVNEGTPKKAKSTAKKGGAKSNVKNVQVEVTTENRAVAPRLMSSALREIETMILACVPIIYVVTSEEERLISDLREHVAFQNDIELLHWSSYTGILRDSERKTKLTCDVVPKGSSEKPEFPKTQNPQVALSVIANYEVPEKPEGSIFLMKDLHTVFNEPIPRQIRDTISWIGRSERDEIVSMIVIAPELGFAQANRSGLPATLEKEIVVVDYDLLTREDIENMFLACINEYNEEKKAAGEKELDIDFDTVQALSRAAQGMTADEIARAMATSIVEKQTLDVDMILHAKKSAIKKSEVLEIINMNTSMDDVGGLDHLKEYFDKYASSFSDEAKEFGVEALKGVMMTGLPGTGKSLAAKAVASLWKLPLLRMDVGKVMGSLVGESERKMREALKHADACAPCVLWIDEVEKGLSGTASSGQSDGGTTARVFGTLLTWMQESDKDVVVIATANDVSQLPPELLRRFNETFFVDLPENSERSDIVRIHLKKRGRDPKKFDVDAIVKRTGGFTGAEIEKAIKEALAEAFTNGEPQVTSEHILRAAASLKPIAVQAQDKIAELRQWAHERARFASSKSETTHKEKVTETKTSVSKGLGKLSRTKRKKTAE